MQRLLLVLFLPLLANCGKISPEENSILQKQCGKPFPKTVAIRRSMHTPKVSRSAAPWVATVLRNRKWFPNITIEERGNDLLGDLYCSGSLISSRHIITAAHCVIELKSKCSPDGKLLSSTVLPNNIDRLTVAFMETCENNTCLSQSDFKPQRLEIKQAFVSSKYTDSECEGLKVLPGGDTAIIELAEDAVFSDLLFPVCLHDQTPSEGDKVTLFGYGFNGSVKHSDGLRQHIASITKCVDPPSNFDNLCVVHPIASDCKGDSGGGYVVYDRRGAAYVAALVSGGDTSCPDMLKYQEQGPWKMRPGYLSDVSQHLHWICAATGICVSKDISETVKSYEEKGLTEQWFRLVKPLSGYDIYV